MWALHGEPEASTGAGQQLGLREGAAALGKGNWALSGWSRRGADFGQW